MKVAVVGATGLVGTEVLKILAERNFPVSKLYPVASERSIGKKIEFQGKTYPIISMEQAVDRKSTRLNSSHRNTSRMPSSA